MTMASVSVVGQQHQQQHRGAPHRLPQDPQLHFDAKKTAPRPRKTSWEKMVFRRSSAGDSNAKSPSTDAVAAVRKGGVTASERCGTPGRDAEGARGSHGGDNSAERAVTANGHAARGGDRTAYRQKVSPCGQEERMRTVGDVGVCGSTLPILERLTQGKTGVVRLTRTEPHRRKAWAIFPSVVDPRVRMERGEGHCFETKAVKQDWCDVCSRQVNTQSLNCRNCSYTCHLECESQVQLDCNQRDRKHEQPLPPRIPCSSPSQTKVEAKEEEEGGAKDLSEEEARQRIEEYNSQESENGMKLASDGSYTGFIKVHLRLSRPVTVDAPASDGQTDNQNVRVCSDVNSEESKGTGVPEKRTSFYLPCDCVKQLHISSQTTTREVIQGLLKKFMVLDNPRKFALYRQTHRDGQDLFQKLPLSERPLLLRLLAGPDTEQLSFVLKENETGEVEWHAFSVPELQNFLVILEKEEAERVRAVEQKYDVYRKKLQQALKQHEPQ